jgi:lycopene cyclase-like protein
MSRYEAVVIGAGPAGAALVAALARQGLQVAWCSRAVDEPWPNNYGIWADELADYLDPSVFEAVWESPLVRVAGATKRLARAYARVDGEELRSALTRDVSVERFPLDVAEVSADGRVVGLEDGREVKADLVFDATGVGRFLREARPEVVAAQTAYGVECEVEGDVLPNEASMSLMDFDSSFRRDDGPATFLYAMELGDRWFLEETVLVGRPAFPIDRLAEVLDERLASRGARIVMRDEEERCFIPMGTDLPSRDQPVIGFGASAGFVHPASGYSLARSLQAAPFVAEVAREAVKTGDYRAVWRAIWPDDRVQSRRLYRFGMETLLQMDRAATERFFGAFFELPDEAWQGYLSDTLSPGGVQAVMLRVFARAPMSIRLRLMRAALGRNSAHLVRGMIG